MRQLLPWSFLQLSKVFVFLVVGVFFLFVGGATRADIDSDGDGIGDNEQVTTNPKVRDTVVTATVRAQQAPPYPILIAPANESKLTSGVVTFEWYAVTGSLSPLDRYELH